MLFPVTGKLELRQCKHILLFGRQTTASRIENFLIDIHQNITDDGVASEFIVVAITDDLHRAKLFFSRCFQNSVVGQFVVLAHKGNLFGIVFIFGNGDFIIIPFIIGNRSFETFQGLTVGFLYFFHRCRRFKSEYCQLIINTDKSRIRSLFGAHQHVDVWAWNAHERIAFGGG